MWIPLKEYKSRSNTDKVYSVKVDLKKGILGCNCPAWIYKTHRGNRWCSHTASTMRMLMTSKSITNHRESKINSIDQLSLVF